MSYATPQDMSNRFLARDLIQLTDPNAAQLNVAVLQTHLDDASNEIDSYLESRFGLPLTDPPAVLTRVCCDIAIYTLQALRPIRDLEDARTRYKTHIAWLTKVSKGELTMGLSEDSKEPTIANPTVVIQSPDATQGVPAVVFTRTSLRDF